LRPSSAAGKRERFGGLEIAALNFQSPAGAIEPCEVVVVGAEGINEALVQILFGEAKTHAAFDAVDVVKLGTLADAVPCDRADAFIMFAKTDAFTEDEIRLGADPQ
jgi:hypothetical protein